MTVRIEDIKALRVAFGYSLREAAYIHDLAVSGDHEAMLEVARAHAEDVIGQGEWRRIRGLAPLRDA